MYGPETAWTSTYNYMYLCTKFQVSPFTKFHKQLTEMIRALYAMILMQLFIKVRDWIEKLCTEGISQNFSLSCHSKLLAAIRLPEGLPEGAHLQAKS